MEKVCAKSEKKCVTETHSLTYLLNYMNEKKYKNEKKKYIYNIYKSGFEPWIPFHAKLHHNTILCIYK